MRRNHARGQQRLPKRTERRILDLVAGGLSYREVAGRVGVHRQTVYKVVRRSKSRATGVARRSDRCPSCGLHVDLPCRVCLARQVAATIEGTRRRAMVPGRRLRSA